MGPFNWYLFGHHWFGGFVGQRGLGFQNHFDKQGDQRELSLLVSQQKGSGKSKGFFGPSRGLKSTG